MLIINNLIVILMSLLVIYFLYRINKTRYLKNHYNKPYMNYYNYIYTIFNNPETTVLDVLFASIAIVAFAIIVGALFGASILSIVYNDYSGFSQIIKY